VHGEVATEVAFRIKLQSKREHAKKNRKKLEIKVKSTHHARDCKSSSSSSREPSSLKHVSKIPLSVSLDDVVSKKQSVEVTTTHEQGPFRLETAKGNFCTVEVPCSSLRLSVTLTDEEKSGSTVDDDLDDHSPENESCIR
jgi:hypothetical protein